MQRQASLSLPVSLKNTRKCSACSHSPGHSQKQVKGKQDFIEDNKIPAKCNPSLPPFTLELLHCKPQKQCNTLEKSLDSLFPKKAAGTMVPLNIHLVVPWEDAIAHLQQIAMACGDTWMQKELDTICTHVAMVYEQQLMKVKNMHTLWLGCGCSSVGYEEQRRCIIHGPAH